MAASLLKNVGLSELVTFSQLDYENLAIALARDPERLRQIRENLALNLKESALFDTVGFTEDLEDLYIQLLERAAFKN